MKTFRNAAMVAAVMLAVTTSPASACAGGGWRILHLEWLCCWIWGNNHKGCKQPESGKPPQTQGTIPNGKRVAAELANSVVNCPASGPTGQIEMIVYESFWLMSRRKETMMPTQARSRDSAEFAEPHGGSI